MVDQKETPHRKEPGGQTSSSQTVDKQSVKDTLKDTLMEVLAKMPALKSLMISGKKSAIAPSDSAGPSCKW